MRKITQAGKEELALALILWKDFKSQGKFDPGITLTAIELADCIGVKPEFEKLLSIVPVMKIVER